MKNRKMYTNLSCYCAIAGLLWSFCGVFVKYYLSLLFPLHPTSSEHYSFSFLVSTERGIQSNDTITQSTGILDCCSPVPIKTKQLKEPLFISFLSPSHPIPSTSFSFSFFGNSWEASRPSWSLIAMEATSINCISRSSGEA